MKHQLYFILLLLASATVLSCDDGDIYPKEEDDDGGIMAQAEITFTGSKGWPSESTLVLAAFGADARYAITTKTIGKVQEGSTTTVELKHIPEEAHNISICILGNARKLIYSFAEYPLNNNQEAISIREQVNLLTYERIQKQVFSQCVACHGGGASAAAGLFLTENQSYIALVNVQATHSNKKLVTPGLVSNSFLIDVLKDDSGLKYDHTDISSFKDEDLSLLEAWVEAGAKNE